MPKIKVIENIDDLQFKLGEQFTSNHITIKKDRMYISKEFASYLLKKPFREVKKYRSNLYLTKYYISYEGAKITIGIRESLQSNGIVYTIAGSCGTYGFNGYQHTQAETLGVRAHRTIFKEVVNIFKSSYFIRLEKVNKLINNILGKS